MSTGTPTLDTNALMAWALAGVPDATRATAQQLLVDTLAYVYTDFGIELPPWLEALRDDAPIQRGPPVSIHEAIERITILEMLRTPLRAAAAADRGGVSRLARTLGVPRTRLRRFLAGSDVDRETFQRASDYVVQHATVLPGFGSLGLALMAAALPSPARERARSHVAQRLWEWLEHQGLGVPEWVEREADWPCI